MKGLKKLVLASAIAAAPFAQAELTAIDDSLLGEMTGQSGITIELDASVAIGSIVYTDGDGLSSGSAASGSVELNTIALGGNGNTAVAGSLDDIKIDIDVDGTDGLVIHLGGTNMAGVLTGVAPVDFGLSVGSVAINNNAATLASNIYIGGNLGPVDVVIKNDSTISVDAFFEVTHGEMDIDVMGMGISNLTIGQDSNPFMASSYGTSVNATIGAQPFTPAAANASAGIIAAVDGADGTVADGVVTQAELDAASITTVASADTAFAGGTGAIIENARTTAGYTGLDNMAYVGMTIATADTSYTDAANASTAVSQALSISVDSMAMDIGMDVALGGIGIGNVAINDLDLSGTTMKIYGH